MKKVIFKIITLILVISCGPKQKDYSFFTIETIDSILISETKCIEKKERIIFFKDTIEYLNEGSHIIFGKDTLTYLTELDGRKELVFINNLRLKKYPIKNSKFNVDSMDLVIDLNELNISYLKYDSNVIIISSKPMNWVGRMTRFSFFQLINSKEQTMVEFIKEDH